LQHPGVLWHATHVRDVEFISENEIVACDGDGTVQIWNVSTGTSRELVPASGREMLALAVRNDDPLLAVAGMTREIALLDWQSSERNAISLPTAGISALCFSGDGRRLACGGRNGTVRVYEMPFDKPRFELATPNAQVNDLMFAKDNSLVASYSNGRVAFLAGPVGRRPALRSKSSRIHWPWRFVPTATNWSSVPAPATSTFSIIGRADCCGSSKLIPAGSTIWLSFPTHIGWCQEVVIRSCVSGTSRQAN
jgi:WD40 repeat protein